ncbi:MULTISPECIES: helix-turn-helix domain-containing protein [Providencia]|uniref:helix-turn-helix domain-containing protein n=1 Tax=Providencia TaxID=586 RepID=UPI000F7A0170|nr:MULTISPECIES: helix-turn-helix transcriptional regulator [Providencia]MBV2190415.1 helix-turn-helix transcriptional regulator [Providencia rettgeri]UPS61515.1 helix-turn-helix transcriptional regulator [Providencia rettgeri]
MKLNKNIGLFIRGARKSRGLSEKELAKLIFVSQQQVSRYERGITSMNFESILTILNVLNVSVDEFIEHIIKPEQEKIYNKMIEELENEGVINIGSVNCIDTSSL